MIKFEKPENLNGAELTQELHNVGLTLSSGFPMLNADGKLCLKFDAGDEKKAAAVVAQHNGTVIAPEPTVAERLASVGLNLDDLKAALGINA